MGGIYSQASQSTPQQHKVTHVERVRREISGQFREKGS